ncbi:hypothetical protein PA10_00026 [Pseudomonas phage pPa_SNUABM_DT01]|nr:hypothetical protein PA10_00026 [Pseudomonas phage pPa_SNUABM_DT01]
MSDFVNYVYDRTIDYIENRAPDNPLREEYARYMSAQNYNNRDMQDLVDVVATIADNEVRGARNDREAEAIVRDIVTLVIDAHVGHFGISDQRIANAVSDDVYQDMRRANAKWEEIIGRLTGRGRGMGGSRSSFGGGRSSGGRSVFETDRGSFGSGRGGSIFGDREQPDERASNSVFGGGRSSQRPQRSSSPVFQNAEERGTQQRSSWAGGGRQEEQRQGQRREEPAPAQSARQEERKEDGPDMTKDRPYDDFWINGENWQIAHRSKFVWTWSPKQQTRRAYDPDNEVRFLVKGKDGLVREEFIAMTDDLVESAHEIREQQRPNRTRHTIDRVDGDAMFVGSDPDAVDLNALGETLKLARKEFLAELEVSNPTIIGQGTSVSNLEEAIVRVAGEAHRSDTDVTSVNTIQGIMLPADQVTMEALDSIKSIGQSDGDLLILQKRLKSLRGTMAENVLTYLDKHFTGEVNAALRDQFGMPKLNIDSFIDDFEDLLNCKAFQKHGTAYSSQFLSRTRVLLASLHYMTEADQRAEFLDCADMLPAGENDPEVFTEFRKNVVVIFKPLAMVHIKLDSDQLGFVNDEVRVPQRSGKGADPAMAEALNVLYTIGRKTSGAGHVYLVSADNICFELVPISGARDIIGIRTA